MPDASSKRLESAQERVVRLGISGGRLHPATLVGEQGDVERSGYLGGKAGLQREHPGQYGVVLSRPDLPAVGHPEEYGIHPDPAAAPAVRSHQTEPWSRYWTPSSRPICASALGGPLVLPGALRRDHAETPDAAEPQADRLREPVGEVVVGGRSAVFEGQHRQHLPPGGRHRLGGAQRAMLPPHRVAGSGEQEYNGAHGCQAEDVRPVHPADEAAGHRLDFGDRAFRLHHTCHHRGRLIRRPGPVSSAHGGAVRSTRTARPADRRRAPNAPAPRRPGRSAAPRPARRHCPGRS